MENLLYLIVNMQIFFINIIEVSIVSSILGIIILIVNKITNKKIPEKINSIFWVIFIVSLLLIFVFKPRIDSLKYLTNENQISKFNSMQQEVYYQMQIGDIKYILPIIYSLIILFKFMKYIIKLIYIRNNSIKFEGNMEYSNIINKIKKELKINKKVKLFKNNKIFLASVYGIISIKVLINNEKIDKKYLDCILTHELCHYKRKDNIKIIILNFLKIVYFFNPIIIYCLNKIEENIEYLTDEFVLQNTSINSKKYCRALISKIELEEN